MTVLDADSNPPCINSTLLIEIYQSYLQKTKLVLAPSLVDTSLPSYQITSSIGSQCFINLTIHTSNKIILIAEIIHLLGHYIKLI